MEVSDAAAITSKEATTSDHQLRPRIVFPILSLDYRGKNTLVMIKIDRQLGVSTDWHFHLIDKDGKAVRNGELTIVRVLQSTSWAMSTLQIYEIPEGVKAQLDSF